MKGSWDELYGEVPASFEARIADTLASLEEQPRIRRLWLRPGALAAAALLAVILGGTALAMDLFGLKSLTVTDPYAAAQSATAAPTEQIIALQGVPESAEFKANAEWMDYLAAHPASAAAPAADSRYALYDVRSAQAAEALDRIVEKYGLRLHSSFTDFDSEQELYEKLGCAPFFTDCAAISGYVYEDGSFQGDGASVAGKCYEYQFGRYVKGSFSEVTLKIGNSQDYEEWIYTNAYGVDVQLSLGPSRCVLMADLPESFVAVNLLGGAKGGQLFMPEPVSRADLETFADLFDFSALG